MITRTIAIRETISKIENISKRLLASKTKAFSINPEERLLLAIFGEESSLAKEKYFAYKKMFYYQRVSEVLNYILTALDNKECQDVEDALAKAKNTEDFFKIVFGMFTEYKVLLDKFEDFSIEKEKLSTAIKSLEEKIKLRTARLKERISSGWPEIIIQSQIVLIGEDRKDLDMLCSLYDKLESIVRDYE